ncbi:trehalose-phosphatase [Streptomyces boncukensis]|uniref:Trehalose 6-phosphate phosphatase n=1 Tax=Streptomyces boncukensis TaxID=2711219 RepID=A0A6G4X7R5_9ACTN|nr:trehalose-phosphatase [Streptomyces boncukensis]NGO73293.1 trehalose-phosphatase [Streptomyces boncukensis]
MPTGPLPVPRTTAGRKALDALLAAPGEALLALDFDGTLSPIVPDPARARAHPGAVPALARLAPQLRAVAVVTGRPAEEAVALGGFAGAPGLERLTVLGAYGAERWDAASGEVVAAPVPPGVAAVREELPALLRELAAPAGTRIEDKGRALAVHTRRTDDPDSALEGLRAPLVALAERRGLRAEPGRMVLELRPPGADKGGALTEFVRETGAGTVVYGGDDLGDLAAYDAVVRLRGEGVPGLLVAAAAQGTGESVPALTARADLLVPGPDGVVALLDALAGALSPAPDPE